MSTRLPAGYYGLELFSGHGSVGRTASKVLGIPVFTIDISDRFNDPTFVLDIGDPDQVVQSVEQYVASRRLKTCAFIWASVPCPEYSRAKTVGRRDLQSADALVRSTRKIYQSLRALLLVIENPGTGLLASRDVIRFIPEQQVYDVDYCQYGFNWQKHTKLFCTQALPNFQPQQCPNHHQKKELACEAAYRSPVTGKIRHVWEMGELDHGQRIAVPDMLVNQICQSVVLLLHRSATAVAAANTAVVQKVSAGAPASTSDSPSSESHSVVSDFGRQAAYPSTPSPANKHKGPHTAPAATAFCMGTSASVERWHHQPTASPCDNSAAADPLAAPNSSASSSVAAAIRGQELLGTAAAATINANTAKAKNLQAAAAAKLQRWGSRLWNRPVEQQHKTQQQLKDHQDPDALVRDLGQAFEQQQKRVSKELKITDVPEQRHDKQRQQEDRCQQQEQQKQQIPKTPQQPSPLSQSELNIKVHDVYSRQAAAERSAKRPRQARLASQKPQLQYIEKARLAHNTEQNRYGLLLWLKLSGRDDLERVWLDDLGCYCEHTNPTECQFGSEVAQQQVCSLYARYCKLVQQQQQR